MTISCCFEGRLGAPAVQRRTRGGKPFVTFSVAVDTGTADNACEWVSVAAFDAVAAGLPMPLHKGERVYCEGRLRLNRWAPADGDARVNLQVTATRVLALDRIGRRATRKPRQRRKLGNDGGTNIVRLAVDDDPSDWEAA